MNLEYYVTFEDVVNAFEKNFERAAKANRPRKKESGEASEERLTFSTKYREAYEAALEIEQLQEEHAHVSSENVKLAARLSEIEDRIIALKSKLN